MFFIWCKYKYKNLLLLIGWNIMVKLKRCNNLKFIVGVVVLVGVVFFIVGIVLIVKVNNEECICSEEFEMGWCGYFLEVKWVGLVKFF